MAHSVNYRRDRRSDLRRQAIMINSDGEESDALILDVSKTGFRVSIREPLKVGERIKLRVERGEEFGGEIRWVLGAEAGGLFLEPIENGKFD